jgi:hypothetical protein
MPASKLEEKADSLWDWQRIFVKLRLGIIDQSGVSCLTSSEMRLQ